MVYLVSLVLLWWFQDCKFNGNLNVLIFHPIFIPLTKFFYFILGLRGLYYLFYRSYVNFQSIIRFLVLLVLDSLFSVNYIVILLSLQR